MSKMAKMKYKLYLLELRKCHNRSKYFILCY